MGLLDSPWLVYIPISWLFFVLLQKIFTPTRRNGSHPPGPKAKPLIGNLFDIPVTDAARTYASWGEKYNSDIVYATALGNHVIALNKLEDAIELLQKRAAIYSDRPKLPILSLMGWRPGLVSLMQYGEEWRLHRKLMQQKFGNEAAKEYHPVVIRKVYQMLKGLVEIPGELEFHNKMLVVSIPLMSMYGYDVKTIFDPFIEAADKSITLGATLVTPAGSLINSFPILRHIPSWFPLAFSRRQADEVKRLSEIMRRVPMDFVTEQFRKGTAPPSFVSDFLEKKGTVGASAEEENAVHNVAFTAYGAAADTLLSATGTFFYQMAINPDIVRKAHEEMDRVIGSTRLPTFEDRGSLLYIEAIYREVMRWMPALPIGLPHCTGEDDSYKGYFIAKGTTVFANIWAMSHDPEVYPDPYTFKPERFFDRKGKLNSDSEPIAYGFGRRICPGKYIASSTTWLLIATILACFNITNAKDEFGNDIEIKGDYNDYGLIVHKKSYKCSFIPRSATVLELIEIANNLH